jgi:hypothetical protein
MSLEDDTDRPRRVLLLPLSWGAPASLALGAAAARVEEGRFEAGGLLPLARGLPAALVPEDLLQPIDGLGFVLIPVLQPSAKHGVQCLNERSTSPKEAEVTNSSRWLEKGCNVIL